MVTVDSVLRVNKKGAENMEEFYTISEIQKMLRIGKNQAYDLCKQEGFPSIKLGNGYRIPKSEFEEWCKKKLYREI